MNRRLGRHAGATAPRWLRGSLATGRSTVLDPRTFVRLPRPSATGYGFALVRPLLVAIASAGLLLIAARPAAAAPPPWYPPLRWLPAASANYTPGRGGTAIGTIVIHATEGPYDGALSWFQDPGASSSAHYLIRARDGEITQMVAEADTAFHARGVNRSAIGIEHEFDPEHGIGYTDAQYQSSATLVCAITKRYGIPADRTHIIGHSEVPGTDHTDPGPTWNWPYYMSLVGACAGSVATTVAGVDQAGCDRAGCAPAPGFGFGATGDHVSLLQWDLTAGGWLSRSAVLLGGGTFGPRTLSALRSFQTANGVPATGFYGPLTAAALRRSLARSPSGAARAGLAIGTTSAEVAQLQRDLGGLGYMDVITGYFGPATRDAVRRFQMDRGIEPTGQYGPLTQAALAVDRP
jgi:N-acetyl-anhydromuramyl-L-alanine amidase AmpD